MTKSIPDEMSPEAKVQETGENYRAGNDYYSTKVMREENANFQKRGYLARNVEGWDLKMREDEENDGDDL